MGTYRAAHIRCKNPSCGTLIVIPQQTPLGSLSVFGFLPTENWPIRFLCTSCGFLSEYSASDVHVGRIETQLEDKPTECLCRVGFGCVLEDCGRRYSVWTVPSQGASEGDVVSTVREKWEPTCGHDVQRDGYRLYSSAA